MSRRVLVMLLAGVLAGSGLAASGCQRPVEEPEYSRALPEGTFGLRRIPDPADWPDLRPVTEQLGDGRFREALARSVRWYESPSAPQFFPMGPISHAHAQASVYALQQLGEEDVSTALSRLRSEFEVWESIGWDGSGTVLYTGYFSPIFEASRERQGEYQYPLYRRPDDLVSDPVTGEVEGRQREDGGVEPYPTRAQIEDGDLLAGEELVYLPSELDAYLIHVNGSAQLRMAEGDTMYIGYAGTNGHEYTSIGELLVEQEHFAEHEMSLNTIRAFFGQNPGQLPDYTRRNDRFVFFREYTGDNWPAGSMGFKVTPMRTLATDKSIFPRGSVVLVETQVASHGGAHRPFRQLMVDQDTGGAIRAAGRGDIYMGIGEHAGRMAGQQAAEGRMYYLLLRPERVEAWHRRMREDRDGNSAARRH